MKAPDDRPETDVCVWSTLKDGNGDCARARWNDSAASRAAAVNATRISKCSRRRRINTSTSPRCQQVLPAPQLAVRPEIRAVRAVIASSYASGRCTASSEETSDPGAAAGSVAAASSLLVPIQELFEQRLPRRIGQVSAHARRALRQEGIE